MAKKQIFNYRFIPGFNQSFNAFPNAVALIQENKEYIRKNITAFIDNQVANNIAPFQNYTYNEAESEEDAGYVLDALLNDVRYDGNQDIRQVASFFWVENVPQIAGDRSPEVAVYNYVIGLINNFILTNVTVTPVYQTAIQQTKIIGSNGEAGASSRVSLLLGFLNDVIENGLANLPALVTPTGSLGKLIVEGNYSPKKLLLINNQTTGEIVYNFADSNKKLKAIYQQQPVNETTISLEYDTSRMNQTDSMQIFWEDDNQFFKPHPSYQDPVEKFRVSQPQSVIDTDFEYSLQGTKWETLTLINNIPSVFSKANEPAFTADQITSISPVSAGAASAGISSTTYSPNGTSGLSLIRNFGPPGYADDANFLVNLPFSIQFQGQTWTSVFVGSNAYFTFGGGTNAFSGFSGTNPAFPHINFLPGDRALMKLYAGTVGGKFIIRFEGSNFGNQSSATLIYEVHFSSNSNVIDVHYVLQNSGSSTVGAAPVVGSGTTAAYLAAVSGAPSAGQAFRIITSAGASRDARITVNSVPLVPFTVGQPIVVRETKNLEIDGSYLVKRVINTQTVDITIANQIAPGTYNTAYTTIYTGGFFTGAEIAISNMVAITGTTEVQINFTSPHGMFPGTPIYVVDPNQNTSLHIGAFLVSRVLSATAITYITDEVSQFASAATKSTASTRIYVRPEGVAAHRFVDGGVQISPGGSSPNIQIIRQTRKYFRYQAGKGIQFSTGVLVRPSYDIVKTEVLTNIFDPVTNPFYDLIITTDQDHGFAQPDEFRQGALVELKGFVVSTGINAYNGLFRIRTVTNDRTFVVNISPNVTDLAPGGISSVEVQEWFDATIRDGMFDEQNGIFYEYDGTQLYAVIRSSTRQLTGTLALTGGSSSVTGVNTKFLTQIKEGEYIVIKGMSYVVTTVTNNTTMTVQPDWRSDSESEVRFNKTIDRRIAQSTFNLDRLDGSGPSGYVFNANRMQMIFIDYSWYGAGKVRWGMRGLDGSILYCHEAPNNNTNTEAYMRSGNLPGRFEILTKSQQGELTSLFTAGSTQFFMTNADAAKFANKGRAVINYETVRYIKGIQTGNITTFDIVERNEFGRTTLASAQIGSNVYSYNQNCAPALSHWGVSVMVDGGFDVDKSYLFSAINRAAISIPVGATRPLSSIRLAPSVDNGIGRPFGIRNLINRSAVTLNSIGIVTTGLFEITVRINSETTLFTNINNWTPVGNGSISQELDHSVRGTTPLPIAGDTVTSFFTEQGDSRFSITEKNISEIRELGNSVLGGAFVYPDGPDVLTVNARNIGNRTESIRARISWTESQG